MLESAILVVFPKSTLLQLPTDHLVHQSVTVLNKSFIIIRANCLSIMNTFDIEEVLAQLTVAEKVELLSGMQNKLANHQPPEP